MRQIILLEFEYSLCSAGDIAERLKIEPHSFFKNSSLPIWVDRVRGSINEISVSECPMIHSWIERGRQLSSCHYAFDVAGQSHQLITINSTQPKHSPLIFFSDSMNFNIWFFKVNHSTIHNSQFIKMKLSVAATSDDYLQWGTWKAIFWNRIKSCRESELKFTSF